MARRIRRSPRRSSPLAAGAVIRMISLVLLAVLIGYLFIKGI